jgi:hypothetical protein
VILRLSVAAVALLGCHHGPGSVAPCAKVGDASESSVASANSLAGEYRLQLASDSEARATVEGSLRLWAADPSLPQRTGPYGLADTTHRYPLVGTAGVDLAPLGAVAPGGTTSSDPSAPGVLVIERTNSPATDERIVLRLGAESNRREQIRFDGSYMVLRVRRVDESGFSGEWESGGAPSATRGRFCAHRTRAPS